MVTLRICSPQIPIMSDLIERLTVLGHMGLNCYCCVCLGTWGCNVIVVCLYGQMPKRGPGRSARQIMEIRKKFMFESSSGVLLHESASVPTRVLMHSYGRRYGCPCAYYALVRIDTCLRVRDPTQTLVQAHPGREGPGQKRKEERRKT